MPGVLFGNVRTTFSVMNDPRLLNVTDAARALDEPHLTRERVNQVTQLCRFYAESLDPGYEVMFGDGEWPSQAQRVAFILAMKTLDYANSLLSPEGGTPAMKTWWRGQRATALREWGEARREAELCATGKVQGSTLNALARAERGAEQRTPLVASSENTPPLVTRSDLPTAWSFD
jgi:hypothetical protein